MFLGLLLWNLISDWKRLLEFKTVGILERCFDRRKFIVGDALHFHGEDDCSSLIYPGRQYLNLPLVRIDDSLADVKAKAIAVYI